MTNATKKRAVGTLVLAAVAGLSYAAGAAKGKAPMTTPSGEIKWEPYAPGVPLQVAKLWGDRTKGGGYGMLLKMPAGSEAGMHSHTADYHAVAVQGTWVHTNEGESAPKDLAAGSYVMQPGKQVHNDQCKPGADCIIFIHQLAKGDFIPAKMPATAAAPAPGSAPGTAPGTGPGTAPGTAPAPGAKMPASAPGAAPAGKGPAAPAAAPPPAPAPMAPPAKK